MIADQTIEEIILLSYLTGMNMVEATYAVLPDFDSADILQTMELTAQLISIGKRMDVEFDRAHS